MAHRSKAVLLHSVESLPRSQNKAITLTITKRCVECSLTVTTFLALGRLVGVVLERIARGVDQRPRPYPASVAWRYTSCHGISLGDGMCSRYNTLTCGILVAVYTVLGIPDWS